MDDRKLCGEDDELEDIYDDPSLDSMFSQICRSDERERRRKEISKRTRVLKK